LSRYYFSVDFRRKSATKSERYGAGHQLNIERIRRPRTSRLLARLARALEASRVPYLVTGAEAVSYYGTPRRSEDIDLIVMTSSPDDLRRVAGALRQEGFNARRLEPGHNTIFDSGFRIDIKVKPELEKTHRIRLDHEIWLNLSTAENLILAKLEFWDGKSFESNDAQDVMKIWARQRRKLNLSMIRAEALKRRTYAKLAKIERYLSKTSS